MREAVGLTADLALRLARATAGGAGKLMARKPELAAATLRRNVTLMGGATAALGVLQSDDRLAALRRRAITPARDRAPALSG